MQRRQNQVRYRTQSGQAALIGLIVVIAIIAILAAWMYPKIAGHSEYDVDGNQVGEAGPMDQANDTACIAYQQQVTQAIDMYKSDHNRNPTSLQDLKPEGITNDIINQPNCQYLLPKYPPAPANTTTAHAPNSDVAIISPQSMQAAPQQQSQPAQQAPAPSGGNTLLPTKMGRSIPLDGGSGNIDRQSGDSNGN